MQHPHGQQLKQMDQAQQSTPSKQLKVSQAKSSLKKLLISPINLLHNDISTMHNKMQPENQLFTQEPIEHYQCKSTRTSQLKNIRQSLDISKLQKQIVHNINPSSILRVASSEVGQLLSPFNSQQNSQFCATTLQSSSTLQIQLIDRSSPRTNGQISERQRSQIQTERLRNTQNSQKHQIPPTTQTKAQILTEFVIRQQQQQIANKQFLNHSPTNGKEQSNTSLKISNKLSRGWEVIQQYPELSFVLQTSGPQFKMEQWTRNFLIPQARSQSNTQLRSQDSSSIIRQHPSKLIKNNISEQNQYSNQRSGKHINKEFEKDKFTKLIPQKISPRIKRCKSSQIGREISSPIIISRLPKQSFQTTLDDLPTQNMRPEYPSLQNQLSNRVKGERYLKESERNMSNPLILSTSIAQINKKQQLEENMNEDLQNQFSKEQQFSQDFNQNQKEKPGKQLMKTSSKNDSQTQEIERINRIQQRKQSISNLQLPNYNCLIQNRNLSESNCSFRFNKANTFHKQNDKFVIKNEESTKEVHCFEQRFQESKRQSIKQLPLESFQSQQQKTKIFQGQLQLSPSQKISQIKSLKQKLPPQNKQIPEIVKFQSNDQIDELFLELESELEKDILLRIELEKRSQNCQTLAFYYKQYFYALIQDIQSPYLFKVSIHIFEITSNILLAKATRLNFNIDNLMVLKQTINQLRPKMIARNAMEEIGSKSYLKDLLLIVLIAVQETTMIPSIKVVSDENLNLLIDFTASVLKNDESQLPQINKQINEWKGSITVFEFFLLKCQTKHVLETQSSLEKRVIMMIIERIESLRILFFSFTEIDDYLLNTPNLAKSISLIGKEEVFHLLNKSYKINQKARFHEEQVIDFVSEEIKLLLTHPNLQEFEKFLHDNLEDLDDFNIIGKYFCSGIKGLIPNGDLVVKAEVAVLKAKIHMGLEEENCGLFDQIKELKDEMLMAIQQLMQNKEIDFDLFKKVLDLELLCFIIEVTFNRYLVFDISEIKASQQFYSINQEVNFIQLRILSQVLKQMSREKGLNDEKKVNLFMRIMNFMLKSSEIIIN